MSGTTHEYESLAGRTALVTGGARRIGAAIVRALSERGAAVVIHYLDSQAEAEDLAAELQTQGTEAFCVQADLADPVATASLVGEAARAAGRPIDLLINNASIFEPDGPKETDPELWDRHQAVNLRAPNRLGRVFAVQLPTDGPADIINLNDIRALRPEGDYLAYTNSKVGLHGLTRSLALALAPRVRVNEIALGSVLPPDRPTDQYEHTLREEIPLQEFPQVAHVTDSLLFLLGNQAVTGQTIQVDGGAHLF